MKGPKLEIPYVGLTSSKPFPRDVAVETIERDSGAKIEDLFQKFKTKP